MKAANAGEAMATVLADEFVRCGMTDACLAPGSRSTPMALAIAKNPALRLHVNIDERSAAFLALGIAKESGRPVGLLTTSGTATANLLPAVIEASLSSVPLVVLTADRPPELRDTGAGQTIDQVKLYGDYVRWFSETGVPEVREGSIAYWRSIACRAWGHAIELPAGPVHLNLAFRDPLVPIADAAGFPYELDGRANGRPWHEFTRSLPQPPAGDVDDITEEVESAERGLVAVGFTDRSGAAAAAVDLAARLGWPLVAEATSGARTGPPAISTYDALLRHPPFREAHRPDLVVRIGSIGLSSALSSMLDDSVRQVVLHDGSYVPDPRRAASRVIRTDPGAFCEELCRRIPEKPESGWLRSWLDGEKIARTEIDRLIDEGCEPSEPALARDLAALLPDGSNLVAASSMPVRDLDWYAAPRTGLRYFSNRGANGIDGFVSTVLGIALSSSGPTAALCGDLSLLHDQNGLIFAANNRVDAVFVVANNNGGGIFSFLPQAEDDAHFERLFGTPHNLDLEALVGAYGLRHRLIEARGDLDPALSEARESGGVHVLEARTDRRANVETHRSLWEAVAQKISNP